MAGIGPDNCMWSWWVATEWVSGSLQCPSAGHRCWRDHQCTRETLSSAERERWERRDGIINVVKQLENEDRLFALKRRRRKYTQYHMCSTSRGLWGLVVVWWSQLSGQNTGSSSQVRFLVTAGFSLSSPSPQNKQPVFIFQLRQDVLKQAYLYLTWGYDQPQR